MWDAIPEKVRESLAIVGALLICPLIGLFLCSAMWAIRRIRDRLPERVRRGPLVCAVVSAKGRIAGVMWIVMVGLLVWYVRGGNSLNELALIRRAQVASGSLVDTGEYEQEDYRGHVYYSDVGVYAYRLSDGREFKTCARVPTGQLEEQEDVEYLPDNPAVSRIAGDGCQTVTGWLCRQVGLGVFCVVFAIPGIALLLNRTDYLTGGRT
jgi:hypothetical protein